MTSVTAILLVLAATPQPVTGEHDAPAAGQKAAAATSPAAAKSPSAAQSPVVFECDFGPSADRNYDGWPDGWTRRHGAGFHDFLKIGIDEDRSDALRGSALFFHMNGGSAEVGSPRISIAPSFSYVLEGEYRLTDLVHDDAKVTLAFLSSKGKSLQTRSLTFSPQAAAGQWQRFRIDPVTPPPQTAAATISLLVAPRNQRQDLRGQVAFRRLQLQRLPRMTIQTSNPLNIFTDKEEVQVRCEIAGISHTQTKLHFELLDHDGRSLGEHTEDLASENALAQATWKPPVPGFGFYRVELRWEGKESGSMNSSATFAVVQPATLPRQGQFGWTLPPGEEPLDSGQMAALLAQAGVHWAKYPVTFQDTDTATADRIAWFAEKLSLQGIEMVGVLDHPLSRNAPIAQVLEDATTWKPWVDPVLTRLSLKVRWWQLGSDQDASLVGFPRLTEKAQEVKQHLERYGQEVKLAAGWQWLSPPPPAGVPLAVQNFVSDPQLTPAELETYLATPAVPAKQKSAAAPLRWVSLDPLPRSDYALATRAHDLVMRMLAAKVARADGVFVPRPFSRETGLMEEDGTPAELFLPWRTTAIAITGGEYIGRMQLPGGSDNYVFANGDRAVMAVWNDQPAAETMYFGEELKQTDLWGHETIPVASVEGGQNQHRVEVGKLPTFVSGLNATIARFKLAAEFENQHVESIFNREQTIQLRLKNFFPQAISGEINFAAPTGWSFESLDNRFRLAPGEEIWLPIRIKLSAETSSGPQALRLDFSLAADRSYKFTVHRTLQLGLSDVAIAMTSRLKDDGTLEVTQQLTNATDKPLSFQCVLFSPGRRRETRQIMAAPRGQTPLLFLLENGESLLGQRLILRAEELGGGRVLNYSLSAER